MKKKVQRKLSIHRETLRALGYPHGVFGGVLQKTEDFVTANRCGGYGTTGTYNTCLDTYFACSDGCATGGACTVTCAPCSDL